MGDDDAKRAGAAGLYFALEREVQAAVTRGDARAAQRFKSAALALEARARDLLAEYAPTSDKD